MRIRITYKDGSGFEVEDDADIEELVNVCLKILWGAKASSYESLMTMEEADKWMGKKQ